MAMIQIARTNPVFFLFLGLLAFPSILLCNQPFKVVAYNVENLFDRDNISLYSDYKKENYGIKELENKLEVISSVLKKIGGKSGPEIILFQEIEVDRSTSEIRSATEELLLELKQKGLGPYYYELGYNPREPIEKWPAVHCLTLSKFPIIESKLHPIKMARPILETTLLINGHKLTLFNNHWKSGASSPEMELHRIENAETLRKRIDQFRQESPDGDYIIAGDLNSHYNQSTVYKSFMRKTGINDILLSSAIEPNLDGPGKKLYNLWHELPLSQRGSDAWRGYWGTLMHIILPSTMYDAKGINYVSDSFRVESFKEINQIDGLEIPFQWSNDLNGFGCSDHFPISALFQISDQPTKVGNNFQNIEITQRAIDYKSAKKVAKLWKNEFLKPKYFGKTFEFSGFVQKKNPLTINIQGYSLGLYSYDPDVRKTLFAHSTKSSISGYGYLSRYRGQWQFIVAQQDWIK